MDVLEIFTDTSFGQSAESATEHHVATESTRELVTETAVDRELAIVPAQFDLYRVRQLGCIPLADSQ